MGCALESTVCMTQRDQYSNSSVIHNTQRWPRSPQFHGISVNSKESMTMREYLLKQNCYRECHWLLPLVALRDGSCEIITPVIAMKYQPHYSYEI